MLIDAHLHWQDPRLERCLPDLRQILTTASVGMAVVNGTSEEDWAKVHGLGKQSDRILCSYGLHPWYIHERSQRWLENLGHWLKQDGTPVGEIGLDRWLRKDNLEEQVEVFLAQWSLANEHKRAVTVHCLKAWGRLLELVESNRMKARVFCFIPTEDLYFEPGSLLFFFWRVHAPTQISATRGLQDHPHGTLASGNRCTGDAPPIRLVLLSIE